MQPHLPFVVPEPSYLKFGTVAVLAVTSAKLIDFVAVHVWKDGVALVKYI